VIPEKGIRIDPTIFVGIYSLIFIIIFIIKGTLLGLIGFLFCLSILVLLITLNQLQNKPVQPTNNNEKIEEFRKVYNDNLTLQSQAISALTDRIGQIQLAIGMTMPKAREANNNTKT
jgi:hypothetical protein